MLLQQDEPAHKRDDKSTGFPHPEWIRFCGYEVVGDPIPFVVPGENPMTKGWAGIAYAVFEQGFYAHRSADGRTIYLLPWLTNKPIAGQA